MLIAHRHFYYNILMRWERRRWNRRRKRMKSEKTPQWGQKKNDDARDQECAHHEQKKTLFLNLKCRFLFCSWAQWYKSKLHSTELPRLVATAGCIAQSVALAQLPELPAKHSCSASMCQYGKNVIRPRCSQRYLHLTQPHSRMHPDCNSLHTMQ